MEIPPAHTLDLDHYAASWLICTRKYQNSCLLQATLESKLSQLGMDASGNKNALVERLMEASQQTTTQEPAAASSQASAVHLTASTQVTSWATCRDLVL